MDKPETVTIQITDELWRHIVEVASPEDLDDVTEFVKGAIENQRASWDYDSPPENYV